MRLQKYIAACGAASRRKAEKMIEEGRVRVNGEPAGIGQQIDPATDEITVDGVRLEPEKKRYLLLYKPEGYVCTSEDSHADRTVHDLIESEERLYTVGRLDKDTQGLILLTNDGALTHALTHPSHQVDKTYEALVQGIPTREEILRMAGGVLIEEDDGTKVKTAPARVQILARMDHRALLEITIHEGRKRQVRKMCQAIGHPVRRLKRVREGDLNLDGLKPGQYRDLREREVRSLYRAAGLREKKARDE